MPLSTTNQSPPVTAGSAAADFVERTCERADVVARGRGRVRGACASPQVGVVRVIGKRLHDRLAERSRGVGKRIREVTGHSIRQPLGDAADAEAGDRHAVRPSLEADQPEWFGPQRRHDQQPRTVEQRVAGVRIEVTDEPHLEQCTRRHPCHGSLHVRQRGTLTRHCQPQRPREPNGGRSDGRNGDRGPFQALEPSEVHDVSGIRNRVVRVSASRYGWWQDADALTQHTVALVLAGDVRRQGEHPFVAPHRGEVALLRPILPDHRHRVEAAASTGKERTRQPAPSVR